MATLRRAAVSNGAERIVCLPPASIVRGPKLGGADSLCIMEGKNLQALRNQLEGQTREIQRLQKEVEQATQRALNSLSASYNGCPQFPTVAHHYQSTEDRVSPVFSNTTAVSSLSPHNHALQLSLPVDQLGRARCNFVKDGLGGNNLYVQQHSLGKSLDEHILRYKESEEIRNMCAPQNHCMRQTIDELHCKSQRLEKERDAVLGLSSQELKTRGEVNLQLYATVQHLQKANSLQNEMLKQSHVCSEFLNKAVQEHVGVLKDIGDILIGYEERSGRNVFEQVQASNHQTSNLVSAVDKVLQELEMETSKLHPAEEQISVLKKELEDKEGLISLYKERYDSALKEQVQQVAVLTQEACSALSHAKHVNAQMETFQEDSKVQCSQYIEKIAQLELTVSKLHSELQSSEDKEKDLDLRLLASDAALSEARTKHTQDSQKREANLRRLSESLQVCESQHILEIEKNKRLRDENDSLNSCNEQFRKELLERSLEIERLHAKTASLNEKHENHLKFVSAQLVSTKEHLTKTAQELETKALSLENAERTITDLKGLLDEKERTFKHTKDKMKKLHALAEAKRQEADHSKIYADKMQEVQKDLEKMRVHLAEKDHFIKSLQLQAENLFQAVGQQTEKINILHGENSQLLEEMKTNTEMRDIKIHELEEENTKISNAYNNLTIERDQVVAELKDTHHNLKNLEVDYGVLLRNHQIKNEEFERTSASLKKQLQAALIELDHVKNTLRTVEGCDGRAIKIALKMQKKITSKRETIDALQSRIQYLEEALSQANKEKCHLKEVTDKVTWEYENVQRCRLSDELENLCTENKGLKEKNLSMQAAMDKAALRFSEYQAIIQHLEQESMRLRLKHALELKELRVPSAGHVTASISTPQSALVPLTQCNRRLKPVNGILTCGEEQSSKNLIKEKPTHDVVDFSGKLYFNNFKEMSAHQLNEDMHDHQHTSLDPSVLHTADLRDKDSSFSFAHTDLPFLVAPCYTSSPKKCCNVPRSEAKSPVHSLLTTPVDAYEVVSTLSRRPQSKNTCSQDSTHGEPSSEVHSDTPQSLHNRLEKLQSMAKDLQIKNKEMALIVRKEENRTLKGKKTEDAMK